MPVDLQALYPKLINLMLDTVFVIDAESRIIFVSDACESLLGYRAEELTGKTITDYMHPEDLEASLGSIRRVMDGQPHTDFRNRYVRKDGGIVHILWSARWYEEEGVRIGVARNVTA
jgi:PAS domain S-box-containing protein